MQFISATAVRVLLDTSQAYPEMLAAINAAADHVELETYILRGDMCLSSTNETTPDTALSS